MLRCWPLCTSKIHSFSSAFTSVSVRSSLDRGGKSSPQSVLLYPCLSNFPNHQNVNKEKKLAWSLGVFWGRFGSGSSDCSVVFALIVVKDQAFLASFSPNGKNLGLIPQVQTFMFTLLLIVNGPQGSHDHLLQTHNVVQLGLLCGGEHELRTKDKVRILLNFFVCLFIYLFAHLRLLCPTKKRTHCTKFHNPSFSILLRIKLKGELYPKNELFLN